MFELFEHGFVWNALLASILISVCGGILGSIIVANKSSFLAGGIAHSAFGGVGMALFFGFSAILGGVLVAILVALLSVYATLKYPDKLDSFVGASWAFGMAIGVIFIDITPGYSSDLASYLFGSIVAVDLDDLLMIGIYDCVLVVFIALYYREIIGIFYDECFCRLSGIKSILFLNFIFVFIAVGIVFSMNMGGLVLILAIMTIPAYIASVFVSTFSMMMFLSSLISLCFMIFGLLFSFYYDLTPGASIVVVSVFGMTLSVLFRNFIKRSSK